MSYPFNSKDLMCSTRRKESVLYCMFNQKGSVSQQHLQKFPKTPTRYFHEMNDRHNFCFLQRKLCLWNSPVRASPTNPAGHSQLKPSPWNQSKIKFETTDWSNTKMLNLGTDDTCYGKMKYCWWRILFKNPFKLVFFHHPRISWNQTIFIT